MRQAALVVAMLILPAVAFAQPVSAEKLRIGQPARLVLSFPCQTTLRVTLLQYLDPGDIDLDTIIEERQDRNGG